MIINEMRLTDAEGHTEGGVGRFIVPIKQCTEKVFPPFLVEIRIFGGKIFLLFGEILGISRGGWKNRLVGFHQNE